jgi:hypothetical protein
MTLEKTPVIPPRTSKPTTIQTTIAIRLRDPKATGFAAIAAR